MSEPIDPMLRVQVVELLTRYCRIVDCKDYDKLEEVFAKDVAIKVFIQKLEFHGIDSFKEFLDKTKPFSEDRMHCVSNISMRVSKKRLLALAYWRSTMTFKQIPIEEAGYYEMGCDLDKTPLRFSTFDIYHKYRVASNVKTWKEVGFPGTDPKISEDNEIFKGLRYWF